MQILLRRLLTAIPTLLLLSFFVFLLLELAPGDAADVLLDQTASVEAQAAVRQELGLDRPFLQRYVDYLGGLLQGDMGTSVYSGASVAREIGTRLPYTLLLVGTAMLLGLAVGVLLGTISAFHKGTIWDALIRAVISINMAVPVFGTALLLVGVFALQLRWLPVFGADSLKHLILPAICTASVLVPGIARLTRASLLDALSREFVLVAHSKGLPRRAVLLRHIVPFAAIPIVTYGGLQAVRLISSLIVIETIFNWPGLGGLAVQAAFDRDPMLLQGATLVIAMLAFALLFMVDVIVLALDPRISSHAV